MSPLVPPSPPRAERRPGPALRTGIVVVRLLDFVIAVARKLGGFCALLTLGWLYARILLFGESLRTLYPGAADPDLRQTIVVALLLIASQGWDIPSDVIVAHWIALRAGRRPPRPRLRLRTPALRVAETTVVTLGRFMDLCVAVANKLSAFAVLVYLLFLLAQFADGTTARDLYPAAADPRTALLADLCVAALVLGWWATPFEQIAALWRRLRRPDAARADTDEAVTDIGPPESPIKRHLT